MKTAVQVKGLRVNVKTVPRLLLLSILLSVGLTMGCTTLTRNECLSADWNVIGYQDGYKGYNKSRLRRHQHACAEYRVTPDLERYLDGYKKGNREFCQPENGFYRGVKGYSFDNVCIGPLSREFGDAYYQGKVIYDLKKDILSEWKILRKKKVRITDLRVKKKAIESELDNKMLTGLERSLLTENLKLIDEQIELIQDYVKAHDKKIADMEHELEHLETDFENH